MNNQHLEPAEGVERLPGRDWRVGVRANPEAAMALSFGFGLLASTLFRPKLDESGNYVKGEPDPTWQTIQTALLALLAREAKRWIASYNWTPRDRYSS